MLGGRFIRFVGGWLLKTLDECRCEDIGASVSSCGDSAFSRLIVNMAIERDKGGSRDLAAYAMASCQRLR